MFRSVTISYLHINKFINIKKVDNRSNWMQHVLVYNVLCGLLKYIHYGMYFTRKITYDLSPDKEATQSFSSYIL